LEVSFVPLYEYECEDCGRFEVIRKFSDPPLAACPTCGKPVQKLLSAPAFQFKGTGWYVTDYARKPTSDSKDGSSKDAKDGPSKDASSKEGPSKDAPSKNAPSKDSASKDSKDSSSSTPASSKDASSSPSK
jgi:putative FmdB family regulatory protein